MKMFGFSRRRMKLGRLKVHLSDPAQGTKSPLRPPKRGESLMAATDHSDEPDCHCSSAAQDINNCTPGSSESWMVLSIAGDKPVPRFNVLSFDQFSWTTASSKTYLSPTSLPLKIPSCKGHSLVACGKKALLIGGKTDPCSEKVSVWAFDTETECWSLMEAKGEVPVHYLRSLQHE